MSGTEEITTYDTNAGKLPPPEGWLKPKDWKQPAYDAVYIEYDPTYKPRKGEAPKKAKLIRFVQNTWADRHGLKSQYVRNFMARLREYVWTQTVEFKFVVDQVVLTTFRPNVIAEGNLRELDCNIQVLGVDVSALRG